MKKVILSLALALSLFCTTAVAANFTDVPTTHTFYTEISQAVEAGYFNGTSENTYNPSGTISNQQFMVVIGRVLGLTDSSEFNVIDTIAKLKQAGIINGTENFALDTNYGQPMTRESMAYIMANVLEYTGEELNDFTISSSRIGDYEDIGTAFRDEVLLVYSNGILMGNTEGKFKPEENLSRGAAAAVIMRLVDSSNRSDVLSDDEYYAQQQVVASATSITIYEGQTRTGRLAQAGDIYVKSDGTTITLAVDPVTGVLAAGQGIAADAGLIVNTTGGTMAITHNTRVNELDMTDSLNNKLQGTYYWINSLTGEGHFAYEWDAVTSQPTVTGTEFAYQLSDDMNWYYSEIAGIWSPVYSNVQTDKIITSIKTANGL